ncbi:MAG: aminomethyl-transferring glycine dehydrogenase subunit GcvPA [Candidatus Latescibacteria bacterium]|nr:aminomethyl-transferring glycine dehydrogenase subunit GcvPA [Candidatus Latescibacterota bacterium]
MSYIPNTDADRKLMLEAIGVASIDELLSVVPHEVRLPHPLSLPSALSELELTDLMAEMADQNLDADQCVSFLGAGVYDHYVPSAIKHLAGRSEYLTAYTPYQPEVSQGTLQGIYEFQTMICELTGLEVANASMYDGASAAAEAMMMACAATKRKQVVVVGSLHPQYTGTIHTYSHGPGIAVTEIPCHQGRVNPDDVRNAVSDESACLIVQHPNFFGGLEEITELETIVHKAGALLVMIVDPISLGLLKSPGEYGADIAVGEGQALGNHMSYGGPALGFMAVKKAFIRRIPGRIAGKTVDDQGRRGFVLTLQAREQHIRRDKATSNICTSQQLNALMATIYLSLIGKSGLKKVADLCLQKSHYAAQQISELPGFDLRYQIPYFKEFVVKTPIDPAQLVHDLSRSKIHAGLDLRRFPGMDLDDCLLVAVTERRTKQQIDLFVESLAALSD